MPSQTESFCEKVKGFPLSPISCQWSFSTSPEDARKPEVLRYFLGGTERGQWHEIG